MSLHIDVCYKTVIAVVIIITIYILYGANSYETFIALYKIGALNIKLKV